jgi:uncharacterized membrane protein YjjB (DUF3815 family)
MILNSFYAFIATLSFCILFNIKGKNMWIASLGGGLGWFVYLLFKAYNISSESAMFYAAICLGIFSEIMARVLKSPVTIFVVPALIPLVPGGGMYYAMLESVQGNVSRSLEIGVETLSNAGALAIGIVLASSFSRILIILKAKKST